jgi:hypothetical protein
MNQQADPRKDEPQAAPGAPGAQGAPGAEQPKKKSKGCLACLGVLFALLLLAVGGVAYWQWDKVGDLLFYKPPVRQKPDIDENVEATFEEFPIDEGFEVVGVSGVVDEASVQNSVASAGAGEDVRRRIESQMKESFDATVLPDGLKRADLGTAADVAVAKYRRKSAGYRADPAAYKGGAKYEERFEGEPISVCVGRTSGTEPARVRVGKLYQQALTFARGKDRATETTGVRISTKGGKTYNGFKILSRQTCAFFLYREKVNVFVIVKCSRKMAENAKELLKKTGESGGIEADPAARRNIYVLPAKRPEGMVFLGFFTRQLDQSYVRSKGNAEWAREMKGVWNTDAVYLDAKGRLVIISYFDAESAVRAVQIYDVLYSLPTRLNKSARATLVRGRGGWFVESKKGRELNFRCGWYINAVNGYPKMTEAELRAIADLLQM